VSGGQLGLTDVHGGAFPDQKVELIRALQAQGRTVAMVGDGINDGPAHSSADVGVSVANAADLSRETADVLLLNPGLGGLVDAVAVSRVTIGRAQRTFREVVAWNTTLLGLGVLGLLTPARSALLHNLGTVLFSLPALRAPRVPPPSRQGAGEPCASRRRRMNAYPSPSSSLHLVACGPWATQRLRVKSTAPPRARCDTRRLVPSARRRRLAGRCHARKPSTRRRRRIADPKHRGVGPSRRNLRPPRRACRRCAGSGVILDPAPGDVNSEREKLTKSIW
jgi:hypothetical protein